MRSLFLIALVCFLPVLVSAQRNGSKLDFRIGAGLSYLRTGDARTVMIENELGYAINRWVSASVSAAFAKSYECACEGSSFLQGNLNIFFSPFRNDKTYDLRLGTGLSYYYVSDADKRSDGLYQYNSRSSGGFNIILENTFWVNDRLLLGLKLFSQPYANGDSNSGILFKVGFTFPKSTPPSGNIKGSKSKRKH